MSGLCIYTTETNEFVTKCMCLYWKGEWIYVCAFSYLTLPYKQKTLNIQYNTTGSHPRRNSTSQRKKITTINYQLGTINTECILFPPMITVQAL